jgi:hypothetical protein
MKEGPMQLAKRTSADPIIPGEKELLFLIRVTEFKIKVKIKAKAWLRTIIQRANRFAEVPIVIHYRAIIIWFEDRKQRREEELNEARKQAIAQLKREIKNQ